MRSLRPAITLGLAGALLLCLLPAPAALAGGGGEFDKAMSIVKSRKKIASRAAEAKAAFTTVVDAEPRNAHAWYNLGLLARREGDRKKARSAFQRALRADVGYLSAKARLAQMDLEEASGDEQRQQARRTLEQMVTCPKDVDCDTVAGVNPYQPEARNLLAELAIDEEKWDDAARHARNVLLGDPDNINAYVNLAVTYYRQGLVDQTWLIVSNALDRRPEAAALHNLMGLVYLSKDDSSRATASFLRALDEDPALVEAKLNMAALELSYGSFSAALKRFDEVLEAGIDDPMVRVSRAVALRGLQRHAEAASVYEAVLKSNPELREVHYNLCVLHQQYTNEWAKAETHCKTFAESLPRRHRKSREMKRRLDSIAATLEALGPQTAEPPAEPEAEGAGGRPEPGDE